MSNVGYMESEGMNRGSAMNLQVRRKINDLRPNSMALHKQLALTHHRMPYEITRAAVMVKTSSLEIFNPRNRQWPSLLPAPAPSPLPSPPLLPPLSLLVAEVLLGDGSDMKDSMHDIKIFQELLESIVPDVHYVVVKERGHSLTSTFFRTPQGPTQTRRGRR